MKTSIQISQENHKILESHKVIDRESFDAVLTKLFKRHSIKEVKQ